jgi:hypothetical protein
VSDCENESADEEMPCSEGVLAEQNQLITDRGAELSTKTRKKLQWKRLWQPYLSY